MDWIYPGGAALCRYTVPIIGLGAVRGIERRAYLDLNGITRFMQYLTRPAHCRGREIARVIDIPPIYNG